MFSPTEFPCTAWYVTATLNVWPLEVRGVTGYSRTFRCDSPSYMNDKDLFATRAEAIAEACRRLLLSRQRYEIAGQRLDRLEKAVARLREGGAA